ncbi:prophage protein [Escherichia coli]|nr:prophage protein [Escherichia coli]
MEVSIDVSTCDADLGNRYFGTVTEALELDTAKNGYILLVQDAEPNFDVNGNYPVTPDGWISCSERMPKETGDIIVVSDGIVMSGISYSRRDGFYIAALEYDDDEPIGGVTHWMPLPEPPRLKEL